MSPPIRDGSGSSIGSIRLGDGTEISEVRTGAGDVLFSANAIPDTVVHQHDAIADYTSGNPSISDSVGSEPISLNGNFQNGSIGGVSGISSDGTDDHGLATTQSIFEQTSFGVAMTVKISSGETAAICGTSNDGTATDRSLITTGAVTGGAGNAGNLKVEVVDTNANGLAVQTGSRFDDNSTHAVIINKSGNSASNISIYVDDMNTAQSDTDLFNENYDVTNHSQSRDLAFFARNNGGSITQNINMSAGVFEFNNEPYSQSERDGFVSRRPEV